jgi:hypothetical protein
LSNFLINHATFLRYKPTIAKDKQRFIVKNNLTLNFYMVHLRNTLKLCIILSLITSFTTIFAQQYPGYTLYSVGKSNTSQLIDTNGTVFHTWTHPTAAKTAYSTYLMPSGVLWRTVTKTGTSFSGGPIAGQVQKVDYNGNILWDFVYSTTTYVTHHDICPMPNGNVLLIAYETKSAAEVAAAGCTTFSGTMWPDKIVEVKPTGATTGEVVWEWHAWDHLMQNTKPTAANYQASLVNHPELLNINYKATKDWLHMNGVNYNPILDQITFSSHNMNEIYVIDHSTTTAEAAGHSGGNAGKGGDILYRWGNPAAYGATGKQIFSVVHDAHWIPEGYPRAGSLVGYNNQGVSSNASCVDIITPPISGYNYTITPDAAYAPSTYTARQVAGGYNSNQGGSQQLPNGNMIVCMGITGYIKEFSPNGTLLWSKITGGGVAKAFRYSDCYINNPAPPIPTVSASGETLSASTATTYQWYLNGVKLPDATNQTYTATTNGIYVVRTTDNNGCVPQYSKGFKYAKPLGMDENNTAQRIKIYPNPSSGVVMIDATHFEGSQYEVIVFDIAGKALMQANNVTSLDLSAFDNGVYFVKINADKTHSFTQKISLIK